MSSDSAKENRVPVTMDNHQAPVTMETSMVSNQSQWVQHVKSASSPFIKHKPHKQQEQQREKSLVWAALEIN